MRRRQVDQPRARERGADRHTFAVHRHRYHLRADRLEDEPRAGIAGIFHGGAVAGLEQQPRRQVEGLLGAGDDGHLARLAAHPARGREVVRHRGLQRRVAHRTAGEQQVGGGLPQPPTRDLGPECGREEVQRRLVGAEGPDRPRCEVAELPDSPGVAREVPGWGADAPGPRQRAESGCFEELVRQQPCDVGARADPPLEIALGRKPLERADDGAAGETVSAGEVSRGGEAGAGPEATVEDRLAQRGRKPVPPGCGRWTRREHEIGRCRAARHSGPTKLS